jgi:hypothetical protein
VWSCVGRATWPNVSRCLHPIQLSPQALSAERIPETFFGFLSLLPIESRLEICRPISDQRDLNLVSRSREALRLLGKSWI